MTDDTDNDDFPELDSALVERITSIDEAEAAQRANALRAGLSDYDLDEDDTELLASFTAGGEVVEALEDVARAVAVQLLHMGQCLRGIRMKHAAAFMRGCRCIRGHALLSL